MHSHQRNNEIIILISMATFIWYQVALPDWSNLNQSWQQHLSMMLFPWLISTSIIMDLQFSVYKFMHSLLKLDKCKPKRRNWLKVGLTLRWAEDLWYLQVAPHSSCYSQGTWDMISNKLIEHKFSNKYNKALSVEKKALLLHSHISCVIQYEALFPNSTIS